MEGLARLRNALPCLLAAVMLTASLGCAYSGDTISTSRVDSAYRVGPPDLLDITILPDPVIEREVVVRPDGMISVDLVGDIPAAGRTTEEVAADIEARIGRFKRDARVTVALAASLSNQITVLGEVRRPSTFPLARQTRLIDAMGQVGGPTNFAARSRVKTIRWQDGSATVFVSNLNKIYDGNLSSNLMLRTGDIVIVEPTIPVAIGYQMAMIFFPFQQMLGFGAQVTTTVLTGGIGAAGF